MKHLPLIAVLLVMISTGMSLERGALQRQYQRMTPGILLRLILIVFVVPPAAALLLGHVLPIGRPALAGLFLISIAPAAPLLSRNIARLKLDTQSAAAFQ